LFICAIDRVALAESALWKIRVARAGKCR